MQGISLRHIYKVYYGKNEGKKFSLKNLRKGNKENNVKRDSEFTAVKDFNMEIEDGEFIVFVGPSGCGKSTTLRMIAGLEEISEGELYIDGRLVNNVEPKDRDIAMVFQSYALYPHMTAYANIAFGLKMRKVPVAKIDKEGQPVLAINKKQVRKTQRELNALEKELAAVENELAALVNVAADAPVQAEGVALENEEVVAPVQEEGVALENVEVVAPVKEEGVALENVEISAPVETQADKGELEKMKQELLSRIEDKKAELKTHQETPVQVYRYKHIPKKEIHEKVMWASKVLGIEELLDIKPAAMSGGQRQRIALGRAMVRDPKVFLLDEPLSNLDAKLRTAMRTELVKLHEQLKTTFIYVTHDQIEAMTMGTRIVVMKLGEVQQIDTPTNLFDYPENKFVAGFIGTPQMNFFDVKIKKNGSKLNATFTNGHEVQLDLSRLRKIKEEYLDGEEHGVIMGVRGEKIMLADESGLKTELSVSEILGNTTHLFVKLAGSETEYIVCVNERARYIAGDSVYLSFIEEHIHMFDKDSERSIMGREQGNL